jgi:small subunit ribosomal protein S16
MAVKLRLQRKGRKKAPFYHIVAADARAPRDGRYIDKLGTYNPLTVPATIELNREKAYEWLMKGAQPTDTVQAILRFKGVLYQKHLAVGVKKGAMTEEQAETKLNAWIEEKEARIAKRKEETVEKKRQHVAAVDGTPKVKVKPVPVVEAPVVEEAAEEVAEEVVAAPVVEEAAPVVEAAAEEVAPAVEAAVEEAAPVVEAAVEEVAPVVEEAAAEATEESAPAAEEKTEE